MTETDPESWKIVNCGLCNQELTTRQTYDEIGVVALVDRPLVWDYIQANGREMPICLDCFRKQDQDGIEVRIADTDELKLKAFRLIYNQYVNAGLCEPNSSQRRITPCQVLPASRIFVAIQDQQVVFTATLVPDSYLLPLPSEDLFPEIARVRSQGLALAEVTCLACNSSQFMKAFMRATSDIIHYCKTIGVDALVITCHPRHMRFYQRILGFDQIGEERPHPDVCDKPAVCLCLDVRGL